MEHRIWHEESQQWLFADEIEYIEQLASMSGGAAQSSTRAGSATRSRQPQHAWLARLRRRFQHWSDVRSAAYWNWSIGWRTNAGPQVLNVIDWKPGLHRIRAGQFLVTRYRANWQYAHGRGDAYTYGAHQLSDGEAKRLLSVVQWHPHSRKAWAPAYGYAEVVLFTPAAWQHWLQENPTLHPVGSAAFSGTSSSEFDTAQTDSTSDDLEDADTFDIPDRW